MVSEELIQYNHIKYNGVEYYYSWFESNNNNFYINVNDDFIPIKPTLGLLKKVRRNELFHYFIARIDDKISIRKIKEFYIKFPKNSIFYYKNKYRASFAFLIARF